MLIFSRARPAPKRLISNDTNMLDTKKSDNNSTGTAMANQADKPESKQLIIIKVQNVMIDLRTILARWLTSNELLLTSRGKDIYVSWLLYVIKKTNRPTAAVIANKYQPSDIRKFTNPLIEASSLSKEA